LGGGLVRRQNRELGEGIAIGECAIGELRGHGLAAYLR
jgi:hypothetical protein